MLRHYMRSRVRDSLELDVIRTVGLGVKERDKLIAGPTLTEPLVAVSLCYDRR